MATSSLPVSVQKLTGDIKSDPLLNDGIRAMKARKSDFSDDFTAVLTGIGVNRDARALLNAELDEVWGAEQRLPNYCNEVIVGGGLHAAAYATARVQSGFPKPLIIESARVGGVFAITKNSTFYLNSRNRPGPESLPGDGKALNFIPGARLQPCLLSNSEFQTNDDLAFCIRMAIAENANTVSRCKVLSVTPDNGGLSVQTERGTVIAGRVIEARGLGQPTMNAEGSKRILSYNDFMRRMDGKFPFRDMRRVAVIGDGDSAKTVIEGLVGQGPNAHMSVSGLDYVEQIDWYGPNVPPVCDPTAFRTRYVRLAGLLPRDKLGITRSRVTPFRKRVTPREGFACAYVNDRAYDCVIVAIGFSPSRDELLPGKTESAAYDVGNMTIARAYIGQPWYQIGAQAPPRFGTREDDRVTSLSENLVAAFRLVPRTATLAANLRAPKVSRTIAAPPRKVAIFQELTGGKPVTLGRMKPQAGDEFVITPGQEPYRISVLEGNIVVASRVTSNGRTIVRRFSTEKFISSFHRN